MKEFLITALFVMFFACGMLRILLFFTTNGFVLSVIMFPSILGFSWWWERRCMDE